jgi:hypothetical protein
VTEGVVLGTRQKCYKKGLRVGYNLPVDLSYAGVYTPIDTRKIYCGDNDHAIMAVGHIMGNLNWCLNKGVGVGKARKAREA